MASEPLFEEQSDAVKMSERHTRPMGAVRIWQRIRVLNILTCVRTHAPIASQDRHFPPYAGEADIKEKGIKFYKSINCQMSTQRTE